MESRGEVFVALTEQEVVRRLRERGYRLTASRRAVIRVLLRSDHHLTPQEIYERARSEDAGIGLVTVYRTLDLLAEMGLVKRLHGENGCHGYAASAPGVHRHYLVCTGCGAVVEFDGYKEIEDLLKKLESKTGFVVTDHWLQVFGLCPECRARKQKEV
jgi:Fe2+ or Zn2+ uptake regulation protein